MDIYSFIVMLHVIGTILGTGGATLAELQITKAIKDNKVSPDERALMHVNYFMIRIGMAIVLVSVIGMFMYFASIGSDALFTNEKLWIKDLMFAMIFINAIALQKRWVPLWLGASISFTSWWGATLLGLAGQLPYTFATYFTGYIVAVFALAGVFHVLRHLSKIEVMNKKTTTITLGAVLLVVVFGMYYLIQGEQVRTTVTQDDEVEAVAEYRELTDTVTFAYPGGEHNVKFVFSIDEAGVITNIQGADIDPENPGRIADFVATVNEQLVGKPLSELEAVDKVGTASLTTEAFNRSVANVQAQL